MDTMGSFATATGQQGRSHSVSNTLVVDTVDHTDTHRFGGSYFHNDRHTDLDHSVPGPEENHQELKIPLELPSRAFELTRPTCVLLHPAGNPGANGWFL